MIGRKKLQLQSKCRNFKRPQLNSNSLPPIPIIRNIKRRLIILKDIAFPHTLNLELSPNSAAALPAQTLVNSQDNALALALCAGERDIRIAVDISVVFAALDCVKHQRPGSRESNLAEDRGDGVYT